MPRTFKIIPDNDYDKKQLQLLLKNKIFFPEETSTPPLPIKPDSEYDYRQFFIFMNTDNDGHLTVYTRDEIKAAEFNQYIPDEDWTDRYYLSKIPVISETYLNNNQPVNNRSFLSYEYPRQIIPTQITSQIFTIIGYNQISDFPEVGMDNKIYLDLKNNTLFRWNVEARRYNRLS